MAIRTAYINLKLFLQISTFEELRSITWLKVDCEPQKKATLTTLLRYETQKFLYWNQKFKKKKKKFADNNFEATKTLQMLDFEQNEFYKKPIKI